MKNLILATLTLVTFSLNATPLARKDCRKNPNDIFESKQGMAEGKHAGDCFTSDIKRNFYVPTEKELAQIGYEKSVGAEHKIIVANFSHKDQFLLAEIPVNKIERVIFQLERFDPKWIAAHTQLRFDLTEPVVLKSQIDGKTEIGKIQSIVFSTEAILRVNGPKYDLIPGFFGNFGAAYRLVSLDQKFHDVVIVEGNPVEQFDLSLTSRQAQDLFKIILTRHSNIDIRDTYNTLGLNCTNTLFRNIDELLNYKGVLFNKTRTAVPIFSPGVLKAIKLIPSTRPTRVNFASDLTGLSF